MTDGNVPRRAASILIILSARALLSGSHITVHIFVARTIVLYILRTSPWKQMKIGNNVMNMLDSCDEKAGQYQRDAAVIRLAV
jgi:hypothetical protein